MEKTQTIEVKNGEVTGILSKVSIVNNENCFEIRGGTFKNVIYTSNIKERITKEIQELENKLKYAGDYLTYQELYTINCQLEILEKVLGKKAGE